MTLCVVFQVIDPAEVLEEKVDALAEALSRAECAVVYTGAGISTVSNFTSFSCLPLACPNSSFPFQAASIPDYRLVKS